MEKSESRVDFYFGKVGTFYQGSTDKSCITIIMLNVTICLVKMRSCLSSDLGCVWRSEHEPSPELRPLARILLLLARPGDGANEAETRRCSIEA